MNSFDDLRTMLLTIILKATKFNVPRIGQVSQIEDPEKKGRILVHIPSLGWDTDDKGAWCFPKQPVGLKTRNKKDYVVVEFLDGDINLPVYSGIATNMKDMLPKNYESASTQVLFENWEKDFAIVYDESQEILKFGEADESYVKGDTAKPELQKNVDALTQLKTDLTAWVPVPTDGGAALKTILSAGFLTKSFADLNDILSERIKGE